MANTTRYIIDRDDRRFSVESYHPSDDILPVIVEEFDSAEAAEKFLRKYLELKTLKNY